MFVLVRCFCVFPVLFSFVSSFSLSHHELPRLSCFVVWSVLCFVFYPEIERRSDTYHGGLRHPGCSRGTGQAVAKRTTGRRQVNTPRMHGRIAPRGTRVCEYPENPGYPGYSCQPLPHISFIVLCCRDREKHVRCLLSHVWIKKLIEVEYDYLCFVCLVCLVLIAVLDSFAPRFA